MQEAITALDSLLENIISPIFDTHAHYTSSHYKNNRELLLERLPQLGVAYVLDCATDYETAEESLRLAEKYPFLYTAVGIHPQSLIEEEGSTLKKFSGNWQKELCEIEGLLSHEKVVAIGEIGLDHHWPVPKEAQLELFSAQLQLAKKYSLPVSIHDREAHADMYRILKEYKPKGVLHAYSGSAADAEWLCEQGLHLGFCGTSTFKNARRALEAAAKVPMENLLLETDCPYLTPEPFRGRQNHSGMLQYVAQKLGDINGLSAEELAKLTCENAKKLFGIL